MNFNPERWFLFTCFLMGWFILGLFLRVFLGFFDGWLGYLDTHFGRVWFFWTEMVKWEMGFTFLGINESESVWGTDWSLFPFGLYGFCYLFIFSCFVTVYGWYRYISQYFEWQDIDFGCLMFIFEVLSSEEHHFDPVPNYLCVVSIGVCDVVAFTVFLELALLV